MWRTIIVPALLLVTRSETELFDVAEVSAGGWHTCARSDAGALKCFGDGEYGQLGNGKATIVGLRDNEMGSKLPPIDLGPEFVVAHVSAGFYHTCARSFTDQLKCFGSGSHGQLGSGSIHTVGDDPGEMGAELLPIDLGADFVVAEVSAGYYHTCARSFLGKVKCFGSASHGQLGSGSTKPLGDKPYEMGRRLQSVDLGPDFVAAQVSAGFYHTCVRSRTGQLKCFGRGSSGQLGSGSTKDIGDEPGEMGVNLSAVDLGKDFVVAQVSAGGDHTCASSTTGHMKCFGSGSYGQLGSGHPSTMGDELGEMGERLPLVNLGPGFVVAQVSAGGVHTCAQSTSGTLKCFGSGAHGQLGAGHTEDLGDETLEMGAKLPLVDLGEDFVVADVSAGEYHTCARSITGKLKCFGDARSGQLGFGSEENVGDEAGEMGSHLPAVDLNEDAHLPVRFVLLLIACCLGSFILGGACVAVAALCLRSGCCRRVNQRLQAKEQPPPPATKTIESEDDETSDDESAG